MELGGDLGSFYFRCRHAPPCDILPGLSSSGQATSNDTKLFEAPDWDVEAAQGVVGMPMVGAKDLARQQKVNQMVLLRTDLKAIRGQKLDSHEPPPAARGQSHRPVGTRSAASPTPDSDLKRAQKALKEASGRLRPLLFSTTWVLKSFQPSRATANGSDASEGRMPKSVFRRS